MHKLMVSYDCGMRYCCDSEAETAEALHKKAMEFDEQGLRWTIEDVDGEIEYFSSIHKKTIELLAALNSLNTA